jgi:hypothetical protein
VLSDAVRRFLLQDIASIERLDVLLLMHRHTERWWAAQAVCLELGMSIETAQSHLERLCAGNLLEVRIADALLYRYHPGTTWLSQLVEEVSRAHYVDRGDLLALMTHTSRGVRLFADAFRFRKGKADG